MKKRKRQGSAQPAFVPTTEQRMMVKILAGFMVRQDDIIKLIPGVNGNRHISKITLHKFFKAELETGQIALRELVSRKYIEAITAGEAWAVKLGLRNCYRWAISDGPLPPEQVADDTDFAINVSFVAPTPKGLPDGAGGAVIEQTATSARSAATARVDAIRRGRAPVRIRPPQPQGLDGLRAGKWQTLLIGVMRSMCGSRHCAR
jgi:hypothetical protein